jgi:hypothetical protein
MAKKNNVIEEIQELIQQIKNEYQEGVDFEIPYYSEKHETGAIAHLSPRLKNFLRKKFDFPSGVNDYLDYSKTNSANNYYYRLDGEHGKEGEFEGLYWRLTNRGLEQEKPKKCKSCGEMTFEENGRMWLWNEKTVGKEFGQDSKVIGYFHPECAKKHFVGKEQSSEKNARIKEKLLRNLDKICLDPLGDLANAELLEDKEIENKYYWKPNYKSSEHKKIADQIYKVEIEGEEVDLEKLFFAGSENYYELKRAIIAEIKQNPQEWKISFSPERPELQHIKWMVQHQSGRRHWKFGIQYLLPDLEKEKYWAEIEALIKGSPLPNDNQENDINNVEWIKSYFQKKGIKKITLSDDGELVITYNNNNNNNNEIKTSQQIVNNSELSSIIDYCQRHNKKEIGWGDNSANTNNTSSPFKNKYLWLVGGIALVAIISTIIVLSFRQKKKKNN